MRLSSGRVRGLDQGAVRTFSGIRYAQPPVGRLRWAPPKAPEPWPGVADATKPGAACPQAQLPGVPPTSEDCLYLNVTMPRDTGGRRLPVMVWLHGGGFTTGAGSQYDAKRLATQGDVIVVTVNYRLGVFGYFGHEELAGSGTFAMADQIAALRWTRRNAAALRKGTFHRVPVISGGTRDEMRSFIGGAIMAGQKFTPERYPELLREAFGEKAAAMAARYPLSAYASPALAWAAVITDGAWACPTLEGDRLLARRADVYAYEFGDPDAPNVNGIEVPGFPLGATHATDLPSLFDLGGVYALPTPAQQRLGARMVGYWTAFARTGDPNVKDAPRWSRFTGQGPVLSLVPDAVKPVGYTADHQCAFWRSIA
ncbi:carboxylesterase family protein [Nonomuraea sp. NPDC048882]|uniref:carboxylesterase/lipase family protein n=1 Tax=Nonomuraea sp. NPDC048882 TaxID=3154347 RepID=UPI00340AD6BB